MLRTITVISSTKDGAYFDVSGDIGVCRLFPVRA